MGIQIEVDEQLVSRGKACYDVMMVAAGHANRFNSTSEGLLVLLIATAFAAQQYSMSPRKLQASMADVRRMIVNAQRFCGDQAGVAEVVTEMGLN
jgi:hypothetical protein